jgi:hypothetical protein
MSGELKDAKRGSEDQDSPNVNEPLLDSASTTAPGNAEAEADNVMTDAARIAANAARKKVGLQRRAAWKEEDEVRAEERKKNEAKKAALDQQEMDKEDTTGAKTDAEASMGEEQRLAKQQADQEKLEEDRVAAHREKLPSE